MKLRHGALILSILVCSGLVLAAYAQKKGGFSPSGQLGKSKAHVNSAELIRARANWFYQQRAYPLGHIPAFARARAWQDFRQTQQTQRQSFVQKFGTNYRQAMATLAAAAGTTNFSGAWAPIGPQPSNDYFYQPAVSGRVSALVVDPCDTSGKTVFLGGAQGGLWVTVNGGTSWTPLTDQAQSLSIGSIVVPPGNSGCISVNVGSTLASVPSKIYVGTGEQNFSLDSYYGAGVLTCSFSSGVTYNGSSSLPCTPDQTFGAYFAGNQTTPTNALNQSFAGPYIGGLAVDPQDSSIMLAAVWGSGSTLPSGIWCSADAGTKWNHVFPSVTREIGTAVAFDQAGYGYAAIGNIDGSGSLNGIYESKSAFNSTSNCSPTFSALSGLTNAAGGVSAMGRISFSVSSTSTTSSSSDEIFAAVANASDVSSTLNGIFKSTDGGNTWSTVTPSTYNNVCASQCFYDIPISIDPRNSSVVYVGGSAPPFPSSAQTTNPNPGPSASIIATTDGGSSWTDVANNFVGLNGPHVDTHAFAFTPSGDTNDVLYVGNDGGVWSTRNPDVNPSASQLWNNLNATLGLTQIYAGMSNDPSGWQYRSYLGSQDNGSQVLGPDLVNPTAALGSSLPPAAGPWAWNNTLFCGDGGATLVDPLIPSTVYSSCAYLPATSTTSAYFGIGKSIFGGAANDSNANPSTSYFEAEAGINTSDAGSFIPPFAIDPEATGSTGDAQTLYFGTYRVWQTTDGGANWSAISPSVTGYAAVPYCTANNNANLANCVLTALAVAPSDSNEVVTGSSVGHIYATTSAGQGASATWTDVTGSNLPGRNVTQVAVDPSNSKTLFATFSGFASCSSCDHLGHVYLGTLPATGGLTGTTWTDITSGAGCSSPAGSLPDIPVNAIVVDPNVAGQLFIGTDVGVYVGELQGTPPAYTGACWQPLGTGLPNSAVLSLTLNNASRTLIAGTHGRSAWAYSLGDQPAFSLASLSPASAYAGAGTFTMTLTGTGFTSGSTVNWTPQGGSATSLKQLGTPPVGCAGPPTCIAVSIPASLTASKGLASVSVSNSSSTTNPLAFSVTPPLLTFTSSTNTLSPSTVPAGSSSSFTLTLSGSSNTGSGTAKLEPCPVSPFTSTITCSYSPGAVSISPSSSNTSTVTINTTAATPPGTYAIVVPTSPGAEYGSAAVQLTVTPAFQASVSPSSLTLGSAASATTTLTLTPASGSAGGSLALQPCTISPATTTISCSYSSNSVTLSGSSAQTDTITIRTGVAGAVPPAAPFQSPPIGWIIAVFGMASMLAFLLMRRRAAQGQVVTVRSRIAAALGFALLAGLLVFSAACGGGGSSSSSTPTGTAAGTYTVTVPITPSPTNGNPTVQLTVQ